MADEIAETAKADAPASATRMTAKSAGAPAKVAKAKPIAKTVVATPAAVEVAPTPVKVPAPVKVTVAPAAVPKPIAAAKSVAKKIMSKTPAPAASSPDPKGMFPMSTAFTSPYAEKVTTMFTGMNERAKAALEKGSKFGEEMTEFSKGNVEAMIASAKTAAKGAETIGAEVTEYGKKSFETATATVKSLTAAKTPAEVFQLQSEYAKTSFDSAVAEMSKLTEAWVKLAGDVFQPISNRYSLAAEKIKNAAL